MLPFAAAHNLRIIAINQRDYVGSSLYTSAELNRITSPDVEHQESALQAQGREIAAFLVHVIKSGGVLQVLQDANEKKTGGLALLGWSLGNLIPLSMFGNAEYLDDETRSTLEGYLRTLVLFGEMEASSFIITAVSLMRPSPFRYCIAPHRRISSTRSTRASKARSKGDTKGSRKPSLFNSILRVLYSRSRLERLR